MAAWNPARKMLFLVHVSEPTEHLLQLELPGERIYAGIRLLPFALPMLGFKADESGARQLAQKLRAPLEEYLASRATVNGQALFEALQRSLLQSLEEDTADAWVQLRHQVLALEHDSKGAQARARKRQRILSAAEGLSRQQLKSLIRFEKAAEALATQSSSLLDIALQTGYSDAAHLARDIKQRTGMTPKALAEKMSPSFKAGSMF